MLSIHCAVFDVEFSYPFVMMDGNFSMINNAIHQQKRLSTSMLQYLIGLRLC